MNIQTEELYINPFTRTVVDKQGSRIYLTAKEFDLLYFMYSHKGQVFTKEQLYQNVWGDDDIPNANNMTSFIRKLRKKIEPNPDNPQYILTVWVWVINSAKKNRSGTSQSFVISTLRFYSFLFILFSNIFT